MASGGLESCCFTCSLLGEETRPQADGGQASLVTVKNCGSGASAGGSSGVWVARKPGRPLPVGKLPAWWPGPGAALPVPPG